jgi:N-acetylglutamate synthase-like GNAT family acetyltransferase
MSEPHIRPLVAVDIPQVIECIHMASKANLPDYPNDFIDYLNNTHYTQDWLETQLKEREFFVAELDNKIVGVVSAKQNEIVNMFVHINYQNLGVGSRLMQKIEDYLKENGFTSLTLSCNLTSKQFYLNRGYNLIARKFESYMEYDIESFDMEKILQ